MSATRLLRWTAFVVACMALLLPEHLARGYIEVSYALGRVINESTNIVVLRVEKVDKEKNLIIYRKVRDLKGTHNGDVIKHNIGFGGFHPREWQTIMKWAEPGKTAVFMYQGSASETCIDNYWYQAYSGGEWWSMSHGEPFLLRTFAGKPSKLEAAVTAMLAGQEVIVPCMVDGDKSALHAGQAKVQRLRASLKLTEYNASRDFVGWGGGDELKRITGMKGFSHVAGLARVDPGAGGVAAGDFDADGKPDLLLYGESKLALFKNEGTSFNEVTLPLGGGARSAAWADFNADGKQDLLLATGVGPRLLASLGTTFKDQSGGLPQEAYYNTTSATWLDYDGDKRPDILLANGFLGLRLYRNLGPAAAAKAAGPAMGPWYYVGPFDNASGGGFDAFYAPERRVDLAATYEGKAGVKAAWKKANFADGQVHSLALFGKPELNNDAVVYLYRQLDFGGAVEIPVSLGSDDTLTVWLNGQKLLAENVYRAAAPDQNQLTLKLRPGKNELLLKICQGSGDFAFYFNAKAPPEPVPPLFEDVSAAVGLGLDGLGGKLKGEHVATGDFDGDGRVDFLLTGSQCLLALNKPAGFVAVNDHGLTIPPRAGVPCVADFNGDGKVDLFVPHRDGGKLFQNAGGRFVDMTAKSGALAQGVRYATGAMFADFFGGGKQDLLVACASGSNRVFRNLGGGKFEEATAELGLMHKAFNTRALGALDVNGDDALDLVFNNEGRDSAVFLRAKE